MASQQPPTQPLEVEARMTPNESMQFLQRLARDDDFRARLVENPGQVLEENGMTVPRQLIPDSVELPAKEAVEAVIDAFQRREALTVPPNAFLPWWGYFIFLLRKRD